MKQVDPYVLTALGAVIALSGCQNQPLATAGGLDENRAAPFVGLPRPFRLFKKDKVKTQLVPRPYYLVLRPKSNDRFA